MSEWTREWPTEPGSYWFYGVPSEMTDAPKMMYVKASLGGGKMMYVTDGRWIWENEAVGWWMPAEVPEAPREVDGK